MICLHLNPAKEYIETFNPKVTFAGKSWTENSRFWIYYDVILDVLTIKKGLKLNECILVNDIEDCKLGMEYGLWCSKCKDGLMGIHPKDRFKSNLKIVKF